MNIFRFCGDMCIIKPEKAEDTIRRNPRTRAWYELEINLAEDGLIGPFDFEANHHIGKKVWDSLKAEAELHEVDVGDLDRIVPIGGQ